MRPKHVIFEAKTLLVSGEAMLCRGEVFLVKGSVPHSVWSNCDSETVMIGISVEWPTACEDNCKLFSTHRRGRRPRYHARILAIEQ